MGMTEALDLVRSGVSQSEAARRAGVSRDALGRAVRKGNTAKPAKTTKTAKSDRPLTGKFGQVAVVKEEIALETARAALDLYRRGVHYLDAARELGVSFPTYYRAVKRGREAAREALQDDADEFRAWETEQGRRTIDRLVQDAVTAREEGNIAAAVAAEKAALAARARLSALWGADAPVKVESKVEAGPDLLGALAASLAAQGPALLAMGNGGTMGDDGDG